MKNTSWESMKAKGGLTGKVYWCFMLVNLLNTRSILSYFSNPKKPLFLDAKSINFSYRTYRYFWVHVILSLFLDTNNLSRHIRDTMFSGLN